MKRIGDFDSLDDFGLEPQSINGGGVEYVSKQDLDGMCEAPHGSAYNVLNAESDGSMIIYRNLEQILSGGTHKMTLTGNVSPSQAELALEPGNMETLAKLGSVYSIIAAAINNIKTNYPNGFLIYDGTAGAGTFMFNNDDTYWYGRNPSAITDYTRYKLLQVTGSTDITATFTITGQTTGRTSNILYVDGTPTTSPSTDFVVVPDEGLFSEIYSKLTDYERDLLYPPRDRTNYWPRDSVATDNLLFEGSSYDDFVQTELDAGLESDNQNDTNIIWNKYYPDGQKNLDTADETMQRLIYTFAANFDAILRYQNQLKYSHTIGYDSYNHVPRDLIQLLAKQWGWTLSQNLNQSDYSKYMFKTYNNYVTGYTNQKISGKDINFEMWRRVLSNLVYLYKKKGTKEALKYLTNIYSIPEDLLVIEELVYFLDEYGRREITVSPSNVIYMKADRRYYYVDSDGDEKSLYHIGGIENTKYLNINVSPANAIEFDFVDWAWENHPTITGPDGQSVELTASTQPDRYEYLSRVLNATMSSDGWPRYASSYPLLEREASIYYTGSVNQFTYATMEPYMEFLDDNWSIMMHELVPASSKLLSSGRLYRNIFWHRETHQWNDSELDPKVLPFNSGATFTASAVANYIRQPEGSIDPITRTATYEQKKAGTVDPITTTGAYDAKKSDTIDVNTVTGARGTYSTGSVFPITRSGEYIEEINDIYNLTPVYSGTVNSANSPRLDQIIQYGTLDYVEFNTGAAVVTNAQIIQMPYSAYNLSDSGYTELRFELFKKKSDDPIVDDDREYSIVNVNYEGDNYGVYRVSSTVDLQPDMFISIRSDYLPFINSTVRLTYVDSGNTTIRTEPKIGLFDLPTGLDGNVIDWIDYARAPYYDWMVFMYDRMNMKLLEIKEFLLLMLEPGVDEGDILEFVGGLSNPQLPGFVSVLGLWIGVEVGYIYGSLLVVDFLRSSNGYWSFGDQKYSVMNAASLNQTRATFHRIVSFFDWADPDQEEVFDNDGNYAGVGSFTLPAFSIDDRDGTNDTSVTGTVNIGGLNSLNATILTDKDEYFLRWKAKTSAPSGWTIDLASLQNYSGVDVIESEYDSKTYNNVKYYGNYFIYFTEPKEAERVSYPPNINDAGEISTGDAASVIISWRGVGDSNRMELQFYEHPLVTAPTASTDWQNFSAVTYTATGITTSYTEVDIYNEKSDFPNFDPAGRSTKDFTIAYDSGNGAYHLFFIDNYHDWNDSPIQGELFFGHYSSTNLTEWTELPNVDLRTYPYAERHMWAPHVLKSGNTWHMFWTGVVYTGSAFPQICQRIMKSTTTDINDWSEAIYTNEMVLSGTATWSQWVENPTTWFEGDCRDPYVFYNHVDDNWIMITTMYSTGRSVPEPVIGFASATTDGNFLDWELYDYKADAVDFGGGGKTESASVFRKGDVYYMQYTTNPPIPIFSSTTPMDASSWDLVTTGWASACEVEINQDPYTATSIETGTRDGGISYTTTTETITSFGGLDPNTLAQVPVDFIFGGIQGSSPSAEVRFSALTVDTGTTPESTIGWYDLYRTDATGVTDETYTEFVASAFETDDTITIPVQARDNVGDDYIYTVQTSLQPDTYYWWRIKNYKSKVSMFGHNIEVYTSVEPYVFKTGDYEDSGADEGEIDSPPEPPEGPSPPPRRSTPELGTP